MANSLGSSVDFVAYCTAEMAECARMIEVYLGASSDSGIRAEHFIPSHLEKVLAEPLSLNLASLYFGEYAELRACLRAVATANLPRKYFYEHAANCAKQELEFHSQEIQRHNVAAAPLVANLSDDAKAKLQTLADTSSEAKGTIVDKIKATMGMASEVTLKEVVQAVAGNREGVTPFGTSLTSATKLDEFEKTRYSGLEARMACPCCRKLNTTPKFLEAFKALEASLGRQLIVTSGYRCPKHNANVGGVKNSQHLLGIAADIHVSGIDNRNELEQAARSAGFTGFGRANNFLHIDLGPARSWSYNSSGKATSNK